MDLFDAYSLAHRLWALLRLGPQQPPYYSGAISENNGVQVESAVVSFSQSNFESGCFQARVKLAPPPPQQVQQGVGALPGVGVKAPS